MSSLNQSPKKRRRPAPKVRTGCRTCKIRRVKCDERKPTCFKCTSTGRTCDGYAPTSGNFEVQTWSLAQTSNQLNQQNPQPALSAFQGLGASVRYLEFYYRCVRPTLSNNFYKEFWSRITLQMAHSELAVRHALVALGALCQNEPGDMEQARSLLVTDAERKVVLYHYNKSIKSLVDRMSEATYSSEIGLVTCLLYVCIELLQGNHQTGFSHMRSGLKIISERRKSALSVSSSSHSNGPPLATATESIGKKSLVEDELMPIFIRGVGFALIHGCPAEYDLDISLPIPSTVLPRPFTTLFEVQKAYHELQNASILHISHMDRTFFMGGAPDAKAFHNQNKLLACHRILQQRLKQFEQLHKLSEEEQVAWCLVKASEHITFVYVSGSMEIRETSYDGHIERLKESLRLCKLVVESKPATSALVSHFSFGILLIPMIYFVAIHCRCPLTRREAVALLALDPPREGLWDPKQVLVVVNRAIELEERKIDPVTGWPVEESRIWQCFIQTDLDRNRGFWAGFLPTRWVGMRDTNGRPMVLQEFFNM